MYFNVQTMLLQLIRIVLLICRTIIPSGLRVMLSRKPFIKFCLHALETTIKKGHRCPYGNILYDSGLTTDSYCFGCTAGFACVALALSITNELCETGYYCRCIFGCTAGFACVALALSITNELCETGYYCRCIFGCTAGFACVALALSITNEQGHYCLSATPSTADYPCMAGMFK